MAAPVTRHMGSQARFIFVTLDTIRAAADFFPLQLPACARAAAANHPHVGTATKDSVPPSVAGSLELHRFIGCPMLVTPSRRATSGPPACVPQSRVALFSHTGGRHERRRCPPRSP